MASTVIGASRQQQDRGSSVETEAGGVDTETEAEAVKILPQGCLEARQCLEAPHHCTMVDQSINIPLLMAWLQCTDKKKKFYFAIATTAQHTIIY